MSCKPHKQAPTLVLLHGLLGNGQDWVEVIADLEGINCLALDLPGHGQNHQVQVTSFEAFHHWLSDMLITRGVSRYCLLGYSLGGRLALYHASRQPSGLEALWLESAHPGLSASERAGRIAHDERWALRFEQEPLEDVLIDWYQQPVFADLTEAQRRRQIQRRLANRGPAVAQMLRSTSLGQQPSFWQWLENTRLPVSYFSGQRDAKFHTLATHLATMAPHLRHITLEGGHNLHAEQPGMIAQQLNAWYRTLG
ncbi:MULTISPECIES: 2-succinyl-6-hydroxy-2,4-cyclohexadiene-1-carboxylate synthase [unclassified Halomonas]|uniref:2-succinyl-6-hydroxy-2, 4-cyclohexadiene-1-carboxylate synthase n=1 Tax=unclassified Halomonas TaxID=2609666 RepID=UPI001CF1CC71|nr:MULTISPECIES: 2-succinyl-6-hydroxy-2,4-cyclohexadiene-1-carboxylate synthase [unclassified Halomonas]MCA8863018.1 2-succinyl-6-hydroxy-2,4-cyclohexadiene-1-carboxylate synthase [Halomonas sp. SBBP1]UZH09477.1 2-succinyl-6-hydroxy-2,4-cyclohexadiene-1-carboxylate synthase [Halomonas sp. BDJS001]